jgi:hypothetical protein
VLLDEKIDEEVGDVLGPLALDEDMVEELISEIMLLNDVVIDEELMAIAPLALDDVVIDEELMTIVPLALNDDAREVELAAEGLLVADDGKPDDEMLGPATLDFDKMK